MVRLIYSYIITPALLLPCRIKTIGDRTSGVFIAEIMPNSVAHNSGLEVRAKIITYHHDNPPKCGTAVTHTLVYTCTGLVFPMVSTRYIASSQASIVEKLGVGLGEGLRHRTL